MERRSEDSYSWRPSRSLDPEETLESGGARWGEAMKTWLVMTSVLGLGLVGGFTTACVSTPARIAQERAVESGPETPATSAPTACVGLGGRCDLQERACCPGYRCGPLGTGPGCFLYRG